MNDGFGELWRRLMALVRRNQLDADLEEEMRLHIELRTQQQTESGTAPDEARYAAQRRFGNTLLLKEAGRSKPGVGTGSKPCCRIFDTQEHLSVTRHS